MDRTPVPRLKDLCKGSPPIASTGRRSAGMAKVPIWHRPSAITGVSGACSMAFAMHAGETPLGFFSARPPPRAPRVLGKRDRADGEFSPCGRSSRW